MLHVQVSKARFTLTATLLAAMIASGCQSFGPKKQEVLPLPPPDVPRELSKVALPDYVIEPPDVLLIDAVSVVPQGPHVVSALDVLSIQATPSFPGRPIDGPYVINSEGNVDLGTAYGSVRVAGLTLKQAADAIQNHLKRVIENPAVSVELAQSSAKQPIVGEHLVAPDGTVNLGTYGRVFVTGMTVEQARTTIERHLAAYIQHPQVSVQVASYNSKIYYVVVEGAGFGDGVTRYPVTGNETVLDAISQINGLSQVSSKQIWIARPAPNHIGCDQILPVDWVAITKGGSTETNYQVLPGDRVFIKENHWISFDTRLANMLAPWERMLGFTLLGTQTVQQAKMKGNFGGVGGF